MPSCFVGHPAYGGRTVPEQIRLALGRAWAFGARGPTAESKLAAQDTKRLRAVLAAGRRTPLTLRELGGMIDEGRVQSRGRGARPL